MAKEIKPGTPEYKKLIEARQKADMEGLPSMAELKARIKKNEAAKKKAPAKKKK